jgi:hypothetical protein
LKVALEPFARTCIESVFGQDLSAGTEAAVRYYANRLESERQPELVPTFLVPTFLWDDETETHSDADVEFEVTVPAEVEATLAAEARRNDVPMERIVDHAVFVYAADLDAAAEKVKAKEAKTSPRYRVYAHPRLQAAASRLSPVGIARARGCYGDRGSGAGSGAS